MRSASATRIFFLRDVVLIRRGNEAILRRKTVKERLLGTLVAFLAGSALCSLGLFASWHVFALFELVLCSVLTGGLFLSSGKVLIRVVNCVFSYSGQKSAPVTALWQRGWNESDSYWSEFGFTDITGDETTVFYSDEAIAYWKYWRELADGLGLPLEDRSSLTDLQR